MKSKQGKRNWKDRRRLEKERRENQRISDVFEKRTEVMVVTSSNLASINNIIPEKKHCLQLFRE
jgi:hypothetical protein